MSWVANGTIIEAFGALATLALAIVGLAGVLSGTLAAIATIIIGAAILMESDFFGALRMGSKTASAREMEALQSPSVQFIGGLTGIVLGVLALLGVSSITLLSVAILVFGATFLLSGASPDQNNWLAHASGADVLFGLGTLVLGLLAVIGIDSLTLLLVALLCLGIAALFSRSAPAIKAVAQQS